jgi:hypothetical protein
MVLLHLVVETFLNSTAKCSNARIIMKDFKVINKSFNFSTKNKIDFMDLTDQLKK